ncbi:MAG: hypothetical protein ABEI96_06010 [Haloarculaceae archaeon]
MTEPNLEALERRLRAVERAVTDDERDPEMPRDGTEPDREAIDRRLSDLEAEVTDLQAAVQAVRGYVGNVRSVNRDVERRADRALAAVERLESDAVDGDDHEDVHFRPGVNGDSADGVDEDPSEPSLDLPDDRIGSGRRTATRTVGRSAVEESRPTPNATATDAMATDATATDSVATDTVATDATSNDPNASGSAQRDQQARTTGLLARVRNVL